MKTTGLLTLIVLTVALTSCKEKYGLTPLPEEKEESYAGGYATGFNTTGSMVLFAVEIPAPGEYNLEISYATTKEQTATASLYINTTKHNQIIMNPTKHHTAWQTVSQKVTVDKGINFISIRRDNDDNGLFNLNYIQLMK